MHALEAWLLADERAIFQVFDGVRAGIEFPSPEDEPNPKSTLNAIIRRLTEEREVSFAAFAAELSDAIDLRHLRQRCRHFDEFARNLLNCVRQWQRSNTP